MVQYYHMFDFHEKRKIMSVLYSKVVIFVLIFITILMSVSVYNRFTVSQEMKEKLADKRIELAELETRAQVLDAKVKYLEDERGIEEELRNRFDVAKEGEQVVVLLERDTKGLNTGKNGTSTGTYGQQKNLEEKSFFDYLKFW